MYKGSLIPHSFNLLEAKISFGFVSAIISPSFISIILSASQLKTSSNLCSIIITVFFSSFCILSISSIEAFPAAGSKLAKGSSKRSISTSSTIVPAKVTLCFCPPERLYGAKSNLFSISTIFDT